MTTHCRVKKCKHNKNENCDLNFRNKTECNIFMYYCDPSSAAHMSMGEIKYARLALGFINSRDCVPRDTIYENQNNKEES